MSLVALLGALLIGNLFVALYVANERYLYFWDYSGYWTMSQQFATFESHSMVRAWRELKHSVAQADYNFLATVPVGTWLHVWGESRLSYELAVTTIYGGSCVLALMVLARAFWNEQETRQTGWIELVPAGVLLLSPAFWAPILRGYIDVGGMALAWTVLWLYFTATERRAIHPAYIGIGILLAVLCLFRRWYAYWVVTFLALATVDQLVLCVQDIRAGGSPVRHIIRRGMALPLVGAAMALTMMKFAMPMVRRVLSTDYSDIYSAYKLAGGFGANLELSLRPIGWLPVFIGLAGSVLLFMGRGTRRVSLFVTAQVVLIGFLFLRVQHFGPHHLYLLLPGYFLVICLGTTRIASLLPRRWLRAGWLGLFIAFGLAISVTTYSKAAHQVVKPLGHLVPRPFYPLVRDDIDEIGRMALTIDHYLDKPDRKIYILSASETFAGDHLIYARRSLPLPFHSGDRVIGTNRTVDKRDGFPRELLDAYLVAVASPIQCVLRPSDQQIVGIPAESFLNGTDIARAFERLPESFTLEGDVKVFLYRKLRPIAPEELALLCERLRRAYPDRPNIYQP